MGKYDDVVLSDDILARVERVEYEMARIDHEIFDLMREREQVQLSDEEYGEYVRGHMRFSNRWPQKSIREYYQMKAKVAQIEEEFSEPASDDPEDVWKWFYEKNVKMNEAF